MQLSLCCYVAHLTASAAAAYGNTVIQGAGITAFAGTQVHCRTLQHFALHTLKIPMQDGLSGESLVPRRGADLKRKNRYQMT